MKKLFVLLLALAMLGTCALAETVNAKDEAVLNIFTWEGYIDYETVIKPFEAETGIKVNYATFASNEEMYEKLSAANGGDYDIVLASDYMLNTTREAGLMQKFDPAIVTNYGNLNPDFTHQFFDPDNEYVIPYVSGIPLIVYDPSVVEIEINGFEDLWDPSLADSLGLIDDARVTIGMVLLSMGQSMNTTDDAVLAEAAEKLAALKPNIHVLEYENLHNYLVSGDIAVAYTFTPFVALALALFLLRVLVLLDRDLRLHRSPPPPLPRAPRSRGPDARRSDRPRAPWPQATSSRTSTAGSAAPSSGIATPSAAVKPDQHTAHPRISSGRGFATWEPSRSGTD